MKVSRTLLGLLSLSALASVAKAFDYGVMSGDGTALLLSDITTEIRDIRTLFLNQPVMVEVVGIEWNFTNFTLGTDVLTYKTFVDGTLQASGTYNILEYGKSLPTSLTVGNVTVSSKGTVTITTYLAIDGSSIKVSQNYQAFSAGAAIVPLVIVLFLASTTHMVEFSLMSSVFVGACMITGNLKDGFKTSLDTYLLEAIIYIDHGFVYLFTLFLSGLVGMLEHSGGLHGFKNQMARFAKTSRSGQLVTYLVGCCIFFDDYTNLLIAGETMRPLTDILNVSREKLCFIVDATAAPIASIVPVSSWVGFEVGLIQTEIDRLAVLYGGYENLSIESTGLGVFLQSIKYRYYPIFMILFIPMISGSQRDWGNMLIAERKVQVYERIDGGDGQMEKQDGYVNPNAPLPDTPLLSVNMWIPMIILVFLVFYMLVQTGIDPTVEQQTFLDILQGGDPFSSLVWATAGSIMITYLMYTIQIVYNGKLAFPTFTILKGLFSFRRSSEANTTGEDGEDDQPAEPPAPRSLMNLHQASECVLYGMGRIFPAMVVLTLAWATGEVMTAVGCNRLFAAFILNGTRAETLPTLSFVISIIMAFATGTSWGTMAILFPLIMVPAYEVSNGDPLIFYATVAGVLSGAVAGDHASPISDTTVLSALATDCKLLAHVSTQAPYALFVMVVSMLCGTIPIGFNAWPNVVGIVVGGVFTGLVIYFFARPIVNKTGSYDPLTEIILRFRPNEELAQLKKDTVAYYASKGNESSPEQDKGTDQDTSMGKDGSEEELKSIQIVPTGSMDAEMDGEMTYEGGALKPPISVEE